MVFSLVTTICLLSKYAINNIYLGTEICRQFLNKKLVVIQANEERHEVNREEWRS